MNNPYSQTNYTLPKVVISSAQLGVRIPVSLGGSFQYAPWIVVSNESPYLATVFDAQGLQVNSLQPQYQDKARLNAGDNIFYIVATALLPTSAPTAEIDISVYPFGEPEGAFPIPLSRQATPTSASGSAKGFNVMFQWSVSGANNVAIAIFNKSTNMVNALVYSIAHNLVVNGTPFVSFGWLAGADPNLDIAGIITPNDTVSQSQMHVTGTISGAMPGFTHSWMAFSTNAPIIQSPQELLLNFDVKSISPGNSLIYQVTGNPATGGNGLICVNWTEQ